MCVCVCACVRACVRAHVRVPARARACLRACVLCVRARLPVAGLNFIAGPTRGVVKARIAAAAAEAAAAAAAAACACHAPSRRRATGPTQRNASRIPGPLPKHIRSTEGPTETKQQK